VSTVSAKERKATQRERLLEGMVMAANREGYAGANVSKVIANAGVSRPTFYDYFTDKDDCFLETNRDIAELLLTQIRDAVAEAAPEQAPQVTIRRLIERSEAQPARAHFLANVTMAGGPRALDERDRTIAEVARIVESARARAAPDALSPDLPIRTMIGAVHRLLAPSIRTGDHDLQPLADELIAWIESYNRPYGEHRWQTLEPGPAPVPSSYASDLALRAPQPLSPGRSQLSSVDVARNQRERIMYATAELAAQKGYTATTIADIVAAAHIDRRVFYTHFRDKQQAFLAVHELAIQQTMAVAAGAFFSATEWPERVWQGILAASQFQATYPTISHMGYVEAHAVGLPAIQRIIDTQTAFTIFLHEGNQYTKAPPSRTAMQAIDAAIFEMGYQQIRAGRAEQLARLAYQATYVALAPYLGPQAANEFVDAKLRENGPVKSTPDEPPAALPRQPRPGA
jgi:AcrR family transcriptional regulator